MKRFLIVFVLLQASWLIISAQVTLEECRELARKNHPVIRMYGLISATRDYSLSNASMTWLPSIHLGALGGISNNPPSLEDIVSNTSNPAIKEYFVNEILRNKLNIPDASPYTYKVQAELSQKIYDGGEAKHSKRYAEAESQYRVAESDVTLEQVYSRIDDIYFSILLMEKRILQTKSQIEVLQSSRDRVSSLLETGSVRPGELDAIEAACIESEQQKNSLESSLKSFRMALSLLTGQDMTSEDLLTPLYQLQPSDSKQILMLDRKINLLALEKEKINISCRPRLEFIADAYYGFPNRNIFGDIASHAPSLNTFMGLRLSWNLTALYSRKNNVGIITNSIGQVSIQKDILHLDIALQNNSISFEMERLQKCIETDHHLVTLRERLRKAAELSFSVGEIHADDLISKVNDEYQARLNADIHEIESLRESYKLRQ